MPVVDPSTIQIKDYLHVDGVRLVEPGTPQWKIKPIQEKNLKLINEYLKKESQRQEEEQKWAAIPEWKKKLLLEKEKKAKELEEAQRRLEEAEQKEKEKFESLPEWKKQLLVKKRSSSDMQGASDVQSETSTESGKICEEIPPSNNVDSDAMDVAADPNTAPGVSSNGGSLASPTPSQDEVVEEPSLPLEDAEDAPLETVEES